MPADLSDDVLPGEFVHRTHLRGVVLAEPSCRLVELLNCVPVDQIGTLEKEVRSSDPPGKRIQKSIKKLLKNFPPKK